MRKMFLSDPAPATEGTTCSTSVHYNLGPAIVLGAQRLFRPFVTGRSRKVTDTIEQFTATGIRLNSGHPNCRLTSSLPQRG